VDMCPRHVGGRYHRQSRKDLIGIKRVALNSPGHMGRRHDSAEPAFGGYSVGITENMTGRETEE
jgi:hypothetical protein